MKLCVCYYVVMILSIGLVSSIMLKKECPPDEVHRSCSFYEEYTCWEKEDRLDRVKTIPKRLHHCKSGCYCKRGFVRQFPHGTCINVQYCRNRNIAFSMSKLPSAFSGFSD